MKSYINQNYTSNLNIQLFKPYHFKYNFLDLKIKLNIIKCSFLNNYDYTFIILCNYSSKYYIQLDFKDKILKLVDN